jgi:hypothetical protein
MLAAFSALALPHLAVSQTTAVAPAITTPDKVASRLGVLEFKDGAPNAATVAKLYDNLDYTHAFDAFNNNMRGVSIAAIHKGLQGSGPKDNEVVVFSEPMDARSLFLTGNADTIYTWGGLDLSRGPMVLEVHHPAPPQPARTIFHQDLAAERDRTG